MSFIGFICLPASTGLEPFGGFEMFNKSNNVFYSINEINEYLQDLETFSKLIHLSAKFTSMRKAKEIDFLRKSPRKTIRLPLMCI